jgi:hypothetical protein
MPSSHAVNIFARYSSYRQVQEVLAGFHLDSRCCCLLEGLCRRALPDRCFGWRGSRHCHGAYFLFGREGLFEG